MTNYRWTDTGEESESRGSGYRDCRHRLRGSGRTPKPAVRVTVSLLALPSSFVGAHCSASTSGGQRVKGVDRKPATLTTSLALKFSRLFFVGV